MVICLPFPDMSLSPNRKNGKHWTSTKKAKDTRYQCAYYATREAMAHEKPPTHITALEISFIEPDRRKRDLDNMLSSIKQDIDAICAAIGTDDKNFDTVTLKRGYSKSAGSLIIGIF